MNSIHQKRYEMNQLKKKRIEKLFQDCQDTIIAQTLSAFGLTQGMFQDRDGGSVTTLHNFKQEDNKFVHERDHASHSYANSDYDRSNYEVNSTEWSEKKENSKKDNKKNSTVEQRSAANGKPEDIAHVKGECFCYRDFSVEEFKNIILEMRAFSKNSFKDLFYKKNCPLSEEDKTFERLTEEINKSFKEWEINTCMRKIQFLAQCYHESAFFSTTLEFASGEYYNPPNPQKATIKTHPEAIQHGHTKEGDGPRYKGRGIIQQTWRDTQISYYKSVVKRFPNYFLNKEINEADVEKELFNRRPIYKEVYYDGSGQKKEYQCDYAALIARDLFLSCDSAGWFWGKYKLRQKKTLNYFSDFGIYGNGTITWMVHGGGNTIATRLKLYRHLRDNVFDYSNKCINKIKLNKKDELLNKDILKQKGYWGEISDEEY